MTPLTSCLLAFQKAIASPQAISVFLQKLATVTKVHLPINFLEVESTKQFKTWHRGEEDC